MTHNIEDDQGNRLTQSALRKPHGTLKTAYAFCYSLNHTAFQNTKGKERIMVVLKDSKERSNHSLEKSE